MRPVNPGDCDESQEVFSVGRIACFFFRGTHTIRMLSDVDGLCAFCILAAAFPNGRQLIQPVGFCDPDYHAGQCSYVKAVPGQVNCASLGPELDDTEARSYRKSQENHNTTF